MHQSNRIWQGRAYSRYSFGCQILPWSVKGYGWVWEPQHLLFGMYSYLAIYAITWWCLLFPFLPAALRAAQACRYLIYSEADFEVFRPAGATRCTDGVEILHGGGDHRSPPPRQISPPSVQRQGCRTPKLKFLLGFDRNLEYKRPCIPCAIFTKFAKFVPHFRLR